LFAFQLCQLLLKTIIGHLQAIVLLNNRVIASFFELQNLVFQVLDIGCGLGHLLRSLRHDPLIFFLRLGDGQFQVVVLIGHGNQVLCLLLELGLVVFVVVLYHTSHLFLFAFQLCQLLLKTIIGHLQAIVLLNNRVIASFFELQNLVFQVLDIGCGLGHLLRSLRHDPLVFFLCLGDSQLQVVGLIGHGNQVLCLLLDLVLVVLEHPRHPFLFAFQLCQLLLKTLIGHLQAIVLLNHRVIASFFELQNLVFQLLDIGCGLGHPLRSLRHDPLVFFLRLGDSQLQAVVLIGHGNQVLCLLLELSCS